MPTPIDFYWSFRSPYCYLAMRRARLLAAERDVEIRLRPVYPLAVRHPDVFVNAPPQRLTYPRLDRRRVAEYFGIPFDDPDPAGQAPQHESVGRARDEHDGLVVPRVGHA